MDIDGATLCGFWGSFAGDRGNPATERDMPTVTPSFVGNSMLPFRCPGCGEVPQELACPFTRANYRDDRPGRENVWCPLCGQRFRIDERGMPLSSALPAGAVVGPSKVERGGHVTWQDAPGRAEATVEGAVDIVFGALDIVFGRASAGGYEALTGARG